MGGGAAAVSYVLDAAGCARVSLSQSIVFHPTHPTPSGIPLDTSSTVRFPIPRHLKNNQLIESILSQGMGVWDR